MLVGQFAVDQFAVGLFAVLLFFLQRCGNQFSSIGRCFGELQGVGEGVLTIADHAGQHGHVQQHGTFEIASGPGDCAGVCEDGRGLFANVLLAEEVE